MEKVIVTDIPIEISDKTEKCSIKHLLSLQEIETALRRTRVSVVYYDPCAHATQPWLWLDTPAGVRRVYDLDEFNQLLKKYK